MVTSEALLLVVRELAPRAFLTTARYSCAVGPEPEVTG